MTTEVSSGCWQLVVDNQLSSCASFSSTSPPLPPPSLSLAPAAQPAVHRICRYCYQLSKAPHTHTYTASPMLLLQPSLSPLSLSLSALFRHTRHLYVLYGSAWRCVGVGVCRRVGNFLRIVSYATVCVRVCVCVSASAYLFSHSAPFSFALHLGCFCSFLVQLCFVGLSECAMCGMRCAACGMRCIGCESAVAIRLSIVAPAKWLTPSVFSSSIAAYQKNRNDPYEICKI